MIFKLNARSAITSLAMCAMVSSNSFALSQKYPTYISLGFGLGNGGNKNLTITTYKPKENATKAVDRINEDSATYMAFEKGTFEFKPKSGIDFIFQVGGVDVKTGIGVEGEFGYFQTNNNNPELINKDLDGTDGASVNPVANQTGSNAVGAATFPAGNLEGTKFSNFKRSSGQTGLRGTLNFLFFPMIGQGSDVYIGAGAGYTRTGVYYKRSADVQFKAASSDGNPTAYGVAKRVNLGPAIQPSGWNSMFQGFAGIRIPFEENSAFDFRVNYILGHTKSIRTELNGYTVSADTAGNGTDAAGNAVNNGGFTVASQLGMIDAAYTQSGENLLIKDEVPHEFTHIAVTVAASFSLY